ncbi:plasmid mobilization protein [Bradyrhizobium sp. Arg314]
MRLRVSMIENIRVRVTPQEKLALRTAARKRGLTLSEFVRETATEASSRVEA